MLMLDFYAGFGEVEKYKSLLRSQWSIPTMVNPSWFCLCGYNSPPWFLLGKRDTLVCQGHIWLTLWPKGFWEYFQYFDLGSVIVNEAGHPFMKHVYIKTYLHPTERSVRQKIYSETQGWSACSCKSLPFIVLFDIDVFKTELNKQ